MAAVVKGVLILESGMIPPTIHFRKGNPKIKFDEWNIRIPTTLTPWPKDGLRRLSTNSFGYGGTNAHAILDDAYYYLKARGLQGNHYTNIPDSRRSEHVVNGFNGVNGANGTENHRRTRLFVLSAADKEGIKRVKLPLADFLMHKSSEIENGTKDSQRYLAELAYTLSQRRSQLQWKTYGIASSLPELSQVLKDEETAAPAYRSSRQPRIGFVFTGQGAQWPRMGVELMEYGVFRESVRAADDFLRSECRCQWSAIEELEKGKSTSQLHLAAYSQTLCTVLQVALVDLLKAWKISPVAVAGHSSGEIGAAYCLGALTREDAWKVAYYRGILSSGMKVTAPELEGSMMAVGASPEQAEGWISRVTKGEVVVACVNSPSSVTISGDTAGIDELLGVLKSEGIFARKLQVDTAYHSPHMQIVAQEYFEAIADVTPQTPSASCKMHSSVIGHVIEASELGPANWVRNLTSSVQFASAIHDMMRPMGDNGKRSMANEVDILVEIGPHSALQGPATQTLKAQGITNIPYHSVLSRNQSGINSALGLAGALFAQGYQVDISQVNNDVNTKTRPLVDLPMYPWNHSQTFWAESRVGKEYRLREQPRRSLIGAPVPRYGEGERLWRGFIRLSEEPWISDHKIQGSILYPGAGFLAMAFEAAHQIADKNRAIAAFRLRDIQLTSAAVISEETDLECIVQLRPHIVGTRDNSSTWTEFTVTSSADGQNLQQNCSGLLIIDYEPAKNSQTLRERDFEHEALKDEYLEAAQLCTTRVVPSEFYRDLSTMGLIYGPAFANLTEIRSKDGQSFCAIDIPDIPTRIIKGDERPHIIHPGTLDAIFHMAFAAIKGGKHPLLSPMVPRSIDEVIVAANIPFMPGTRLTGFSNAAKHGFKELKADIVMLDEQPNRPVVQITGFRCSEVGGASSAVKEETAGKKICSKLLWKPAIEVLSSEEQREVINSAIASAGENDLKRKVGSTELLALRHIDEILQAVPKDQVIPAFQDFYSWMQQQKNLFEAKMHPFQELLGHGFDCADDRNSKFHGLNRLNSRIEGLLVGKAASGSSEDKEVFGNLYLETAGVKVILAKLAEVSYNIHIYIKHVKTNIASVSNCSITPTQGYLFWNSVWQPTIQSRCSSCLS